MLVDIKVCLIIDFPNFAVSTIYILKCWPSYLPTAMGREKTMNYSQRGCIGGSLLSLVWYLDVASAVWQS